MAAKHIFYLFMFSKKMKAETKQFLRSKFGEYYRAPALLLPPQFHKRELGFIFFDESYPDIVMRRHKAFNSGEEFASYLENMAPAHIFHSAAYYRYPDAPSMKEKGWEGADLIFDLDADQVIKERTSYSKMLEVVKLELGKLINDFLIPDFGFSEKEINLVFSGGRGYHIHIRVPEILQLENQERREIVDFLTGQGLDKGNFLRERVVAGEFGTRRRREDQSIGEGYRIPSSDEPGWGGKVNKAIVNYFKELRSKSEDEAISELIELGAGKRDAKSAYFAMNEERWQRNIENLKEGNLDFFKKNLTFWEKLMDQLIDRVRVKIETTTDEPVTADVHRLIRMPGSLHGGTGLRVVPLKLNELESFDPLCDAVVFGNKKTKVLASSAMDLSLKGETFKIAEGVNVLPEFAAIFLMCRGVAEYEP